MNKLRELKESIYKQLSIIVDRKIETAKKSIKSAKEARNQETKSSVGDKFETGRAMMQFELEKNEVQLSKALNLKKELSRVDFQKEYNSIEFGSLTVTDQGNYFISIGIGKIEVNNESIYAISLASPIGKMLYGKKIGDIVQFQNIDYTIKNIV